MLHESERAVRARPVASPDVLERLRAAAGAQLPMLLTPKPHAARSPSAPPYTPGVFLLELLQQMSVTQALNQARPKHSKAHLKIEMQRWVYRKTVPCCPQLCRARLCHP